MIRATNMMLLWYLYSIINKCVWTLTSLPDCTRYNSDTVNHLHYSIYIFCPSVCLFQPLSWFIKKELELRMQDVYNNNMLTVACVLVALDKCANQPSNLIVTNISYTYLICFDVLFMFWAIISSKFFDASLFESWRVC